MDTSKLMRKQHEGMEFQPQQQTMEENSYATAYQNLMGNQNQELQQSRFKSIFTHKDSQSMTNVKQAMAELNQKFLEMTLGPTREEFEAQKKDFMDSISKLQTYCEEYVRQGAPSHSERDLGHGDYPAKGGDRWRGR